MPPRKPSQVNTAERSLVILIQALEGRKLMVELRNDVLIRGKLEAVDDFMNLTLCEASCQTLTGGTATYEFLYVKGRNIRFVHMPRAIEPAQIIEQQRKKKVEAQLASLKARFRSENQGRVAKGQEDPGVQAADVASLARHTAAEVVKDHSGSGGEGQSLLRAGFVEQAHGADARYSVAGAESVAGALLRGGLADSDSSDEDAC